ncbi:hypothetical protein [Amycolatopsis sp. CA-230715]|uniref:hypothetical protein n=1 Tax=Amycolatopsis sp. CA-230715 TaxID=2745196 RepID=UPI001C038241|nr:hypothetical protein [Amycolatopsis sp. CA-230715]QWF84018.1 hypothetical protein HUW46_07462 [Amycolatopsis sp. CA-230715]
MRAGSTNGRTRIARTLTALACALALSPVTTANAAAYGGSASHRCECASPSIDRLQQWLASGEGTTVPATGSLLVREGDRYAAKVRFLKAEWHVIVVWLGNQFEAQADLSKSSGFWLTYSATDDLYVQLRPASHWSGGDKWLTKVPSTGGKLEKRFFSFSPDAWTWLPELGKPSYSFASALGEARGLVFVGKTPNTLDFRALPIDGYQPPCR